MGCDFKYQNQLFVVQKYDIKILVKATGNKHDEFYKDMIVNKHENTLLP